MVDETIIVISVEPKWKDTKIRQQKMGLEAITVPDGVG